jgi:tetratricopeptide (TPR) repeat protein
MRAKILIFLSLTGMVYSLVLSRHIFAESDQIKQKLVINKNGDVSIENDTTGKEKLFIRADPKNDTTSTCVLKNDDELTRLYVKLTNDGAAYTSEGRYEEAVSLLTKATIIKPSMPYAYINLSDTYYHMGKHAESVKASKSAIKLDSSNAASYSNLGNAYYALRLEAEAKESYQKAIELYRSQGNVAGVEKIEKRLEQYALKELR